MSRRALIQQTGHYVFEQRRRQRIGELIEAMRRQRSLWNLLRSEDEGGQQGYFYVCGKTSFAVSVLEALKRLFGALRRVGSAGAGLPPPFDRRRTIYARHLHHL